MGNLLVRDVPDDVVAHLKERARANAGFHGGSAADTGGGFVARHAQRTMSAPVVIDAPMIAERVIDASVAIKWVITVDGTDAANHLRWSGTTFHAPDLLVPETGDILWQRIQRGELTRSEAELACGILHLAKVEFHAMGPQAPLALQMAAALEHPVYDTTYLALARTLNIPFVTADRRLVAKLAGDRNPVYPEIVLLS